MKEETKKINDDLYFRDTRITSTDDPLTDYYSTLTPSAHLRLKTADTKSYTNEVKIKGHKIPDPRKHQIISFIKSAIRLGGYLAIPFNLELAVIVLILSELVGIAEELV